MKTSISLKVIATVLLAFCILGSFINLLNQIRSFMIYYEAYVSYNEFFWLFSLARFLRILFYGLSIVFIWYLNEKSTNKWLILPLGLLIGVGGILIVMEILFSKNFEVSNIIPELVTIFIYTLVIINVLCEFRFNIACSIVIGILPIFILIFDRFSFDFIELIFDPALILMLILGRQSIKTHSYDQLVKLKEQLDRNLISLERFEKEKEKLMEYI